MTNSTQALLPSCESAFTPTKSWYLLTKPERYSPPLTSQFLPINPLGYQIYADCVKILLPSQEPVDLRSKHFIVDHIQPSTKNDTDDDIVKCFDSNLPQSGPSSSTTQPPPAHPIPPKVAPMTSAIHHILPLIILVLIFSQTETDSSTLIKESPKPSPNIMNID